MDWGIISKQWIRGMFSGIGNTVGDLPKKFHSTKLPSYRTSSSTGKLCNLCLFSVGDPPKLIGHFVALGFTRTVHGSRLWQKLPPWSEQSYQRTEMERNVSFFSVAIFFRIAWRTKVRTLLHLAKNER